MSVTCPDCGAVASYGREIGHRTDCPSLVTIPVRRGTGKGHVQPESISGPSLTVTIPRSQHEALMAALEPFDEFAARIEKERPGWYHDQFSFMHSVGGEYDVPMKWFIGARNALAKLRAAGAIKDPDAGLPTAADVLGILKPSP